MQDPRKVLRQHNIRMKDFVGNKITLFEKDEIERAQEILKKAKIDSSVSGLTLTITGELKEDTTTADIGVDTVVSKKCNKKDCDKIEKKKGKIWNTVKRRLALSLNNEKIKPE